MKYRIVDTNILIAIWHGRYARIPKVTDEASAKVAAKTWLHNNPADGILTPIRLEFVAGSRDREELKLCDAFLDSFPLVDKGKVLPQDWDEAERFVRWIPQNGRSRGVIDCLIRAICIRLNCNFDTDDTGVPPQNLPKGN